MWEMRSIKIQGRSKEEIVKEAVKAIEKGRVIVSSTDTVYGLLADATNKKAVHKALLIKGREKGKPFPIFVRDIAMAKSLARVSSRQETILKKSWPGKITLVLESRGKLPKETGTKEYIGLRIPKHKLVQEILEQTKRPFIGTSANLAGKPSLSEGKAVIAQFQKRKHKPDMVFDAGKLPRSQVSKVIDITKTQPKILRK